MSQTEELEYKRAALQILNSILGELVPDFWKTLIDQWEQEGRPAGIPSTNSQKWPLSGYRCETPCTKSLAQPRLILCPFGASDHAGNQA